MAESSVVTELVQINDESSIAKEPIQVNDESATTKEDIKINVEFRYESFLRLNNVC